MTTRRAAYSSPKDRKEQAESACREADLRDARKQLRKAGQRTDTVLHILRSRRAKRSIPPALREALLEAADGIRVDLRALKSVVRCPDDAP